MNHDKRGTDMDFLEFELTLQSILGRTKFAVRYRSVVLL